MGGRDHAIECEHHSGTFYSGFNGPEECPLCQPAPPDPQGQAEIRDTETAYVEVLAICEACGGRIRWDQVDAHEHYKGPGHRARAMEFVEALPYLRRISDLEAQLDQAERRVEEAKADANEANHQANMMSRSLQAANALAASYRQGLEQIAEITPDENDPAHGDGGYDAGQIARSLLNPSSTSEGDA